MTRSDFELEFSSVRVIQPGETVRELCQILQEKMQKENKEIQIFILDLRKYKQCSLLHHSKGEGVAWKTTEIEMENCLCYVWERHSAYTRCEPQAGYQQGLPREWGEKGGRLTGRLYIQLTDCWPKIDQAAKQEEEQHKANEMKWKAKRNWRREFVQPSQIYLFKNIQIAWAKGIAK